MARIGETDLFAVNGYHRMAVDDVLSASAIAALLIAQSLPRASRYALIAQLQKGIEEVSRQHYDKAKRPLRRNLTAHQHFDHLSQTILEEWKKALESLS